MIYLDSKICTYEKDQLEGFRHVTALLVNALVNQPSNQIILDMQGLSALLGADNFNDLQAGEALDQRYYDRFFVASSQHFVPLQESSILGMIEHNGRIQYASSRSQRSNHVKKCYLAVGFDYTKISGFAPAVSKLRADSMASQLAFMSFLANNSIVNWESNKASAEHSCELLNQFISNHSSKWFEKAAECMRKTDDDFYAKICDLASKTLVAWSL